MFIRRVPVKGNDYFVLVESYRDDAGMPRHRTLLSLGRHATTTEALASARIEFADAGMDIDTIINNVPAKARKGPIRVRFDQLKKKVKKLESKIDILHSINHPTLSPDLEAVQKLVKIAAQRNGIYKEKPTDHQRLAVYRWERKHVVPPETPRLLLKACRALVREAYRWWPPLGVKRPPVVAGVPDQRLAKGGQLVLILPPWSRTPAMVLHEYAHALTSDEHCPRFVAAYVALLERFVGLPREQLLATLAAARIDIAPDLVGP